MSACIYARRRMHTVFVEVIGLPSRVLAEHEDLTHGWFRTHALNLVRRLTFLSRLPRTVTLTFDLNKINGGIPILTRIPEVTRNRVRTTWFALMPAVCTNV